MAKKTIDTSSQFVRRTVKARANHRRTGNEEMHLLRAGLAHHAHQLARRRATHNRIVDHDDNAILDHTAHNVELAPHLKKKHVKNGGMEYLFTHLHNLLDMRKPQNRNQHRPCSQTKRHDPCRKHLQMTTRFLTTRRTIVNLHRTFNKREKTRKA